MKRLISSLAALVAVACLVSACGQKGPLYLPEDGKDGKGPKSRTSTSMLQRSSRRKSSQSSPSRRQSSKEFR